MLYHLFTIIVTYDLNSFPHLILLVNVYPTVCKEKVNYFHMTFSARNVQWSSSILFNIEPTYNMIRMANIRILSGIHIRHDKNNIWITKRMIYTITSTSTLHIQHLAAQPSSLSALPGDQQNLILLQYIHLNHTIL